VRRVAAAILAVAAACSGAAGSSAPRQRELLVFAAASLNDTFTTIGAAFERENPGVHIRFNFGPSDGLATGISEGARVDVFAAAGAVPMDRVASSPGVVDRTIFARNRLVLIVPRDDPAHIAALPDIARPGVLLSIAAPGVPAGTYARVVLAKAGLSSVLRRSHSDEVDVRGVVSKVALGEADAGFVYATDVTAAVRGDLMVIPIPDALNVIAAYPIAVVAAAPHGALARAFLQYVLGPGQATLRAGGFLAPL